MGAAVAVILRRGDDGDEGDDVLFIRRPRRPGDRWSGDIAFPGGLAQPGEDAAAAARREAHEEVGLALGDPIGVLGDRITAWPRNEKPTPPPASGRGPGGGTVTTRNPIHARPPRHRTTRTGPTLMGILSAWLGTALPPAARHPFMRVRPVLFRAPADTTLTLDPREVEEAFRFPLRRLRRVPLGLAWRRVGRVPVPVPALELDGRELWGLTLAMVGELRRRELPERAVTSGHAV